MRADLRYIATLFPHASYDERDDTGAEQSRKKDDLAQRYLAFPLRELVGEPEEVVLQDEQHGDAHRSRDEQPVDSARPRMCGNSVQKRLRVSRFHELIPPGWRRGQCIRHGIKEM